MNELFLILLGLVVTWTLVVASMCIRYTLKRKNSTDEKDCKHYKTLQKYTLQGTTHGHIAIACLVWLAFIKSPLLMAFIILGAWALMSAVDKFWDKVFERNLSSPPK